MSKLVLKAIPSNATTTAAEQTLGNIDTTGSTQRVSVKAQAKTVYRLVDAKTGEVVQQQTVLRQGKKLLVTVDGVNAVEIDNFFPDEAGNATAPVDSPSYLVDTGTAGAHSYGAVTAQTPVEVSANGMSVLWTPGMPAMPVAEPVAFGASAMAAVSGLGSAGSLLAAVGVAAAAGGGGGGGGGGGADAGNKPTAKITGAAFKAEVADNTGLVVEAFDSTGKSRGKAEVGKDGKYVLTLDDPAFKGSLVLKMYDGLPNDGKTPKFYDEATGETKDFTKPLYAVVNYGGDAKEIKVNITPLTNLAATVAGVDTRTNKMTVPDGKTADQVVKEANIKVAQKFGLNEADLTAADVQTTKSDTVNAYGIALAVMSKMEEKSSQDAVAEQFKSNSSAFTTSLQNAVTALKDAAGTNNDYLKNIDTSKLDKVSTVASDTTAPVLVTTATKANTNTDGTKVYLHFDSELSKNTAGVDKFTVNVTTPADAATGKFAVSSTPTISSVEIDGNDVVLTLATKIAKGQTVTVSYTDPTLRTDDLLAVQDLAGNDAASVSLQAVTNSHFGIEQYT
jgi:Putative flagellar system-associated repeat